MTNVFDAQVRAVDQATGPIRAMVRGMKAIIVAARGVSSESTHAAHNATAAGHAAAKAIQESAHEAEAAHLHYIRALSAHVNLLRGHFGELRATIGEVGGSFAEFLPALGALGVGASLVGLVEMTKEAAEATLTFQATAIKIGVTAKELIGLNWAAKESGVSTDVMAASLEKFNKTLGLAAAGKNKDAVALFKHIGLNIKSANGHIKSASDLLPDLAEAFAKTEDPAIRARAATTLFGKVGQELLPVLMKGKEALEEMEAAGRKFGYIATPKQTAALLDLAHGMGELDAATAGFKREIAANLAPILAPIVHSMTEWMLANRDWIATGIAGKVQALADAIRPIIPAIQNVMEGTTSWGNALMKASEGHHGLIALAGGLALALGSPLIIAVTGAITIMTTFGNVLLGLTALAWANPIVADIGLVAAGAFLIYEKWEPVKAFFVSLWEVITHAFEAAWSKIQPILDSLKNAVEWARNSGLGRALGLDEQAMEETERGRSGGNRRSGRPSGLSQPKVPPNPWGGLGIETLPAVPQFPPGYQPGSLAAPPVAQQTGEVHVQVDLNGLPPGASVTAQSSGIAAGPRVNVGRSNPLGDFSTLLGDLPH